LGLCGLEAIIKPYNEIVLSGSYVLDLMVWRDLDLFVDIQKIKQEDIYDIATDIFNQFKPTWLETKNTFNETSGCPQGYFLGFETNIVENNLWNIDIWFTNNEHINQNQNYLNNIKNKLPDHLRTVIMDIKHHVCSHPLYGHQFFSIDLYDAVLNHKINSYTDFKAWLEIDKFIKI